MDAEHGRQHNCVYGYSFVPRTEVQYEPVGVSYCDVCLLSVLHPSASGERGKCAPGCVRNNVAEKKRMMDQKLAEARERQRQRVTAETPATEADQVTCDGIRPLLIQNKVEDVAEKIGSGITATDVTAIVAEPCLQARRSMAKPGGFITCHKAGCKKIMCATVRAAKRHGTAADSPLLCWVKGKNGDINDEAKNNIEWCYADPLSCNTETAASPYIPGLVYSYKACGFSNEFESAFFSPMREQSFGGAFFQRNSYSFTSLEQCTIKNSRAEKGGGFFLGDGASTVTKSTIVGNTATKGSNLYADNGVFSYVLPAPECE
ncbi:hypothetical protein EMIHUDRAFT_193789 [Emiliania huxleyi CCMP1516]|uniref:Right handed beta helix domain-containing protein n=2 Tax=Emiliania huxleyi TaxID=2903 RepID=A0A0D3L0F5_EMIH1|nr:hypothetical protein EMIHUDRAFT_193789 [Emiliania huxleyi CCMP1516]EOD41490.1 hypothetical protein EMIHUDRAFT_193789 [Emiliania huxleyi CCMP1516]|eukprot:XP_005793919.1 hypothetical protein EMIHUDRAFT_193789 [Emiliania huxleyi CCMP1516]